MFYFGKRYGHFVLFFFLVLIFSCQKNPNYDSLGNDLMQIPIGFPELNFPQGNEFTQARWTLGKQLFYDPRLSLSNKVSCASCHVSNLAFSDSVAFSLGDANVQGRTNSPTLTNIAYNPYFTRAGGVATLEMQILVPIQEHDEFNANIVDIVEELKLDSNYVNQAMQAYNRELDPFVITRSIANFERSFISGNSAYDKFIHRQNKNALSVAQQRGMSLFMSSRTNCSKCHSGFNFSNYAFENNGLYLNYADSGRMRVTRMEVDRAKFKVPTLRNVEFTGPYMHDGSLKDLKAVVAHYNGGGTSHKSKNPLIKPLGLTANEQNDLVLFLKSLSDFEFIQNKNFSHEE